MKKENFLIVHTEEEFEKICIEKPDKIVHYLKKDNQNFIWQKSRGPISGLKEYILKKEYVSIDEANILNENESILIILTDPGMGKSTILGKLIQDSIKQTCTRLNSDQLLIKIVLNNFAKTLKRNERKSNKTPRSRHHRFNY